MDTKISVSSNQPGLTLSLRNPWSENPFLRTPSLTDLPFHEVDPVTPSMELFQPLSTPTSQFLFPKFVTEEQKEFANGFVAALEKHHRNESPLTMQELSKMSPVQSGDSSSESSMPTKINENLQSKTTSQKTSFNSAANTIQLTHPIHTSTSINETFTSSFPYQISTSQQNNLIPFSSGQWNQGIPITKSSFGSGLSGDYMTTTLPLTVQNPMTNAVPASSRCSPQTNTSFETYKRKNIKIQESKEYVPNELHSVPSDSYFEQMQNMSWNGLRCSSASPSSVGTSDLDDQDRVKLERKRAKNREAAQRCQQRKAERISRLENKVEHLREQNSSLNQTVVALRMEITRLQQQIISHTNRGCHLLLPSSNTSGNIMHT